jgi:hypothetical protein
MPNKKLIFLVKEKKKTFFLKKWQKHIFKKSFQRNLKQTLKQKFIHSGKKLKNHFFVLKKPKL